MGTAGINLKGKQSRVRTKVGRYKGKSIVVRYYVGTSLEAYVGNADFTLKGK